MSIGVESFGQAPTEAQKKQAEALASQSQANQAKYGPYVGRKFAPKEKGIRPQTFTVTELLPMMPLREKGVRPVFRVTRSPLPAAYFADCEEFLSMHNEVVDPPA